MDVVAEAATRLTHSDAAVVEIRDGNALVYRAGTGRATNFMGLRLDLESSLSGLCMMRNEALRCDDTENDERVDRLACRAVGARSMLVTPLRYREQPLGVLKVYASDARAFDDTAVETLRLLAGLIAATMHRAVEYEGMLHRALHDGLTGLPNRERLESVLATNIEKGEPFAVVLLDLNGFKEINDAHGHARGDRVLQTIAQRLTVGVRSGDLATRLGGDEFVILLQGFGSRASAAEAVKRLADRVSLPILDDDDALSVSAAAGIALFPSDARTPASLLASADADMYAAKHDQSRERPQRG